MKIKVTPEDFIVRELVDLTLSEEGRHRVYIMEKRGWNTADAVESVARASGISPSLITYAGLKDRHALTCQHISVPEEHELRSAVADIRLTLAGHSADYVSSRVLIGNTFEITLRSLSLAEVDFIRARLPEVRRSGFPNYFDDQRFGSVTERGEFLGERVVKGHLKGALRLYMTAEYPGQRKVEKERRQAISAAWGDWPTVLPLCRTQAERDVVQALGSGGNKKNLLAGVNAIPHAELAMYFAAFQSFIWNRSLRIILERSSSTLYAGATPGALTIAGKAGPYVFYRDLPQELVDALRVTQIPTVSRKLAPCSADVLDAVTSALVERELSLAGFNLRGIRAGYFKSFYRPAVVVPDDLGSADPEPDDLYEGRAKVRLRFSLPRGSYATMLLKALSGTAKWAFPGAA